MDGDTNDSTKVDAKRLTTSQKALLRPLLGRARRRCPECGVEIDIMRPRRAVGRTTSANQRQQHAAELRVQILWEAIVTCPPCKGFWQSVVRRAEEGDPTEAE
jgi:hypothetical protein